MYVPQDGEEFAEPHMGLGPRDSRMRSSHHAREQPLNPTRLQQNHYSNHNHRSQSPHQMPPPPNSNIPPPHTNIQPPAHHMQPNYNYHMQPQGIPPQSNQYNNYMQPNYQHMPPPNSNGMHRNMHFANPR